MIICEFLPAPLVELYYYFFAFLEVYKVYLDVDLVAVVVLLLLLPAGFCEDVVVLSSSAFTLCSGGDFFCNTFYSTIIILEAAGA